MKKIANVMFALVCAVVMGITTGCTTVVNNQSTAAWIGCTTHEAYCKVAEKASPEVKAEVESLWVEIDSITNAMDITNVYARVADKIDVIIKNKEITDKQKVTLNYLRKIVDKMVDRALSSDSEKKDKAIAWLKAWREGIRMMRKLESGTEVEVPELVEE